MKELMIGVTSFVGSCYLSSYLATIQRRNNPAKRSISQTYDCIIVGGGIAGLAAAHTLINEHKIDPSRILLVEALSYVGGRIKQAVGFIDGVKVDVGAEILHGGSTSLANFASEMGEEMHELFVWAQGDDGPMSEELAHGGYGLYYTKSDIGQSKLLRYDDTDREFVTMNTVLSSLHNLDPHEIDPEMNLETFLHSNLGTAAQNKFIPMVSAGFSNTMCTTNKHMSLREIVRWKFQWDEEEGEDGDYRLENSFVNVIEKLADKVPVALNTCVDAVTYVESCAMFNLHIRRKKSPQHLDKDKGWALPEVLAAKTCIVAVPPKVLSSGRLKVRSQSIDNALYRSLVPAEAYRRNMFPAMKVICEFSKRCWPRSLTGMIMGGPDLKIPEIWFHEHAVKGEVEPNRFFCVGFLTAEYFDALMRHATTYHPSEQDSWFQFVLGSLFGQEATGVSKEEKIYTTLLDQMTEVFSHLSESTLCDNVRKSGAADEELALVRGRKPRDYFVKGMIQSWDSSQPFIPGGYSSVRVSRDNKAENKPCGADVPGLLFAGEGLTKGPGATAHAAFDTGVEAAHQVYTLVGS